MKYFIKLTGCLTAKNKLQEAVEHALKDNDCMLVNDVETFVADIKGDIEQQTDEYPKCSPDSVKVVVHPGYKQDKNARIDVGEKFITFVLYKVRGQIVSAGPGIIVKAHT